MADMVIELIPQLSAIMAIGVITGLIAYYVGLCTRVKNFMDKRKEEYAEKYSEYIGEELKKLPLDPLPLNWQNILQDFWRKGTLQVIDLQEKILSEAYEIKHSLETMRDAFFGSIISFIITIIFSFTMYSSYAIFLFIIALLLLLYGIFAFIEISRVFLD